MSLVYKQKRVKFSGNIIVWYLEEPVIQTVSSANSVRQQNCPRKKTWKWKCKRIIRELDHRDGTVQTSGSVWEKRTCIETDHRPTSTRHRRLRPLVTPGRGSRVTTPTWPTASKQVETGSTASWSERHGTDTATARPEEEKPTAAKTRSRPYHTFVLSTRRHTRTATPSHTSVRQLTWLLSFTVLTTTSRFGYYHSLIRRSHTHTRLSCTTLSSHTCMLCRSLTATYTRPASQATPVLVVTATMRGANCEWPLTSQKSQLIDEQLINRGQSSTVILYLHQSVVRNALRQRTMMRNPESRQ